MSVLAGLLALLPNCCWDGLATSQSSIDVRESNRPPSDVEQARMDLTVVDGKKSTVTINIILIEHHRPEIRYAYAMFSWSYAQQIGMFRLVNTEIMELWEEERDWKDDY